MYGVEVGRSTSRRCNESFIRYQGFISVWQVHGCRIRFGECDHHRVKNSDVDTTPNVEWPLTQRVGHFLYTILENDLVLIGSMVVFVLSHKIAYELSHRLSIGFQTFVQG